MSVILLYTPYDREFNAQKIIFLLSLLILAAVVHILLFRLLAQMEQRKQLEHMELQGKALLSQIQAYEEMEQAALRRSHDARHHATALAELIRKGEREQALEYLKQYETETQSAEQRFCEHRMVNTIVSAYARKARLDGIPLNTDIAVGKETNVSDVDFVAILANILENAIRACRESQGDGVSLHIQRKGRKLVITCVNPC
ncbi:MAG: GHKL domain-containing protein, partial [Synergistaceae bacterium]|nr:GHKL domain-containing protein [Synergistaceae bacterium]